MNGTVTIVVPEAPAPAPAAPAAQRRIEAGALRIGVLDNSKSNADHLLAMTVEGIKAALPVASVVSLRKSSMAYPASNEMLTQLAQEADYVISAMAD